MYSLTKNPITLDTAQKIVAEHFGTKRRLDKLEELGGGFYNAAYLLELDDGLKYVLKIAPRASVPILRYEKDILRAEVEVMRLVKERTEIPLPAVLYYDPTFTLVNSEFYIMDFLPGVALNIVRKQLSIETQYGIDFQLGRFLRQMNDIAGDSFGCFALPEQSAPIWRAGFDRILQNVLQDGKDIQVELPRSYDDLLAQMQECYAVLDEITSPSLVHWDLWDGNVFINPENGQIYGLIDFERALWADPLMEVNFGAFGENPAFLAGYGREMLDTPAKRCRRVMYNIYLFLIMVIECYYRQYATTDQENWARLMLQKQLELLDAYRMGKEQGK